MPVLWCAGQAGAMAEPCQYSMSEVAYRPEAPGDLTSGSKAEVWGREKASGDWEQFQYKRQARAEDRSSSFPSGAPFSGTRGQLKCARRQGPGEGVQGVLRVLRTFGAFQGVVIEAVRNHQLGRESIHFNQGGQWRASKPREERQVMQQNLEHPQRRSPLHLATSGACW